MRRRLQRGSLHRRVGKTKTVWVGQWWEDTITNGTIIRLHRKQVLGDLGDLPTKKLAQRKFDETLDRINSRDYRPRTNQTVGNLIAKWEELHAKFLKPSTLLSMRSHVKLHLGALENVLLTDVNTELIQRFVNSLELAPKSVRNVLMTLRSLWNSGKAVKMVTGDPFEGVKLPRRTHAAQRAFSLNEIAQILNATSGPLKLFLWLAAETGLRAGELCGLCWEDMHLAEQLVQVRQSVWRGKFGTPKTKTGVRHVGVSEALVAALRRYQCGWRPNKAGLLFAAKTGAPWDANLLVTRKLGPLLDSLSIVRGGLHAFRHANASFMNTLNVDVKTRQARLGHATSAMTLDVYTHAEPAADRSAAEQLGAMISKQQIAVMAIANA